MRHVVDFRRFSVASAASCYVIVLLDYHAIDISERSELRVLLMINFETLLVPTSSNI